MPAAVSHTSRAQGATEYLVLLAVVLIIALVSIALLGFFPGLSSGITDAQSRAYWSSSSPISITEWGAKYIASTRSAMYLRLKNSGSYPIRIVGILANSSEGYAYTENNFDSLYLSDYLYLSPGEEKYIGDQDYFPGLPQRRRVDAILDNNPSLSWSAWGFSSVCPQGNTGSLVADKFGFEYVQYVEGQTITKKQVAQVRLVIKCG